MKERGFVFNSFSTPVMEFENEIRRARIFSMGYERDPICNPFPRLFVGDGKRLSKSFLKSLNVTHVVNCATNDACPLYIPSKQYACIHAIDGTEPIMKWYPKFKHVLDAFLTDPMCQNIYIHCQCGINRSVALTLAYVVRTYNVPVKTCFKKMLAQRPCILTNPSFLKDISCL